MIRDPIVEEVRRNRTRLSRRFKNDVRALVKDAQRRQAGSKRRLVSFSTQAT
jgi:hypothetical protein